MNSTIRIKSGVQRLVLVSAGLLLYSNTLFAADVDEDAQMQARDLLCGTVGGQPRTVSKCHAPPSDAHEVIVDAQEQARRLILGNHETAPGAATAKKAHAEPEPSYSDAQDAARRMILGSRDDTPSARRPRASRCTPSVTMFPRTPLCAYARTHRHLMCFGISRRGARFFYRPGTRAHARASIQRRRVPTVRQLESRSLSSSA